MGEMWEIHNGHIIELFFLDSFWLNVTLDLSQCEHFPNIYLIGLVFVRVCRVHVRACLYEDDFHALWCDLVQIICLLWVVFMPKMNVCSAPFCVLCTYTAVWLCLSPFPCLTSSINVACCNNSIITSYSSKMLCCSSISYLSHPQRATGKNCLWGRNILLLHILRKIYPKTQHFLNLYGGDVLFLCLLLWLFCQSVSRHISPAQI